MEQKSIIDLAIEFDKDYIDQQPFSLTDTGVSHRLITYWDEKDLLFKKNDEKKWRKFNFEELIWIRMIAKLRQFSVGVETIKQIKHELFKKMPLEDLLSPNSDKTIIDPAIDKIMVNQPDSDKVKRDIEKKWNKLIKDVKITYFNTALKSIYIEKINLSIIIALANTGLDEEVKPDSSLSMAFYCPEKLEELAKTEKYFEIFSRTFISISLNELINDCIININPAKLPRNLTFLTDAEKKIFNAIRSGEYTSVTVRFNDNSKPKTLEITEVKKIKMESRLFEILHNGAYQDIEIKSQNGEIYHCTSKRKIKLSE